MSMLKRFASLGLALVLTGALAACGNNNGTDVGRVGVDWTGNDINVEAVADPEIKGVVCHVAYFNRSLIDRRHYARETNNFWAGAHYGHDFQFFHFLSVTFKSDRKHQ